MLIQDSPAFRDLYLIVSAPALPNSRSSRWQRLSSSNNRRRHSRHLSSSSSSSRRRSCRSRISSSSSSRRAVSPQWNNSTILRPSMPVQQPLPLLLPTPTIIQTKLHTLSPPPPVKKTSPPKLHSTYHNMEPVVTIPTTQPLTTKTVSNTNSNIPRPSKIRHPLHWPQQAKQ